MTFSCKLWDHKYLEISFDYDRDNIRNLYDSSISLTRRTDHAGFHSNLFIGPLLFEFDIYDDRHWDYDNNCWEDYSHNKRNPEDCYVEELTAKRRQVVQMFWEKHRKEIPSTATTFVSAEELIPMELKDCFNKKILNKEFNDLNKDIVMNEAFCFFIDLEPEANWSHNCLYIFMNRKGDSCVFDGHEWPLNPNVELDPIPRILPEIEPTYFKTCL